MLSFNTMNKQINSRTNSVSGGADCLWFDAATSELLTARLLEDDVEGMISLAATASGPECCLEDRLSWRLEHRAAASSQLRPPAFACDRLPQLCVILSSRRVLRYLALTHPQLLLLTDRDSGSNLLHCMAETSCSGTAGYEAFQAEAFELLRQVVWAPAGEDPWSDSPQVNLLHRLCRMENAQGLRPLEFSMLIGAYFSVRLILGVEGYLLIKQGAHGIRVRSAYDFAEYDLMDGERRDKNPLLMLTRMSPEQADQYAQSGLQDAPVMKKWIDLTNKDMKCTLTLRLVALSILASSFTPFSNRFDLIVPMAAIGYELETGFERYTDLIKLALSSSNSSDGSMNHSITDLEKTVRANCSPASLIHYLTDKSNPNNTDTLFTSPLWGVPIQRTTILKNWSISLFILGPVLVIQLAVLLLNCFKELQFARRFSRWTPTHRRPKEYLVQSHYFLTAYALSFMTGIIFIIASMTLERSIDCTDYVLGRRGPRNLQLTVAANVSECSAVLYIFFTLFSVLETYESGCRSMAFLCISFRRAISRFVGVLPLFILWTYIVFGSLFYMTDVLGKEFAKPYSVFYSPLRLLLNIASPAQDFTSVVLHTFFILVVGINAQNFIIAIISNSFDESVNKFDMIYTLSLLNNSLHTWQLYGWLTRMSRRACGSREKKNETGCLVRVWSLKPR